MKKIANKQVRLNEDTLKRVKTFKKTSSESYDEIINRLLDNPDDIKNYYWNGLNLAEREKKVKEYEEYSNKLIKHYDMCNKIINKHKRKKVILPARPIPPEGWLSNPQKHFRRYVIKHDSNEEELF